MKYGAALSALLMSGILSTALSAEESLSRNGSADKGVTLVLERHEPGVIGDDIIIKIVNNSGRVLKSPMIRCVLKNSEGRAMDIASAFYDDIPDGEAGYEKLVTTASDVRSFSCKSQEAPR